MPPSPWDPWEAEAFIVSAWRRLSQNSSRAKTVKNAPAASVSAAIAISITNSVACYGDESALRDSCSMSVVGEKLATCGTTEYTQDSMPPSPWSPWEAETFVFSAWRRLLRSSQRNSISRTALPSDVVGGALVAVGCACQSVLSDSEIETASTSHGLSPLPSDNSDLSSSDAYSSDDEDVEELFSPVPPPQLYADAKTRGRLSPLLAKTLRHSATAWGLHVRPDGYASVSELLRLKPFEDQGFTSRDVEHVVQWERQESKKQRFSLRHSNLHGLEIRANQGHSVLAVDDQLLLCPILEAELPETLVHGTYSKHVSKILAEGLRPMNRHHIHLFLEDGDLFHGRREAEVMVYVDVKKSLALGIEFLRSENRVLLSTGGPKGAIPPACFQKVVNRKSGAVIADRFVADAPKSKYVPPHQRPDWPGLQKKTALRLEKAEQSMGMPKARNRFTR